MVVALLVESRPEVAAVIAVVLLARLFLYLLAPGWGLYLTATVAMERRGRRRGDTGPSPGR